MSNQTNRRSIRLHRFLEFGQASCCGWRKLTTCYRLGADTLEIFIGRSSSRSVFLEMRQVGIHRIPWLSVGRPNVVLRFIQTRIVQSPGCDALSEIRLATKQSRTTVRTKTARIIAHHFAGRAELFRCALCDFERVRRDIENRSVPAAGRFLTVATMTIERHNWFGSNFITNGTAGTAAGNGFHSLPLKR